ncbi:MAG TPA: DUF1553 domain-containing protein [Candidatus Paceibacterota bacterium]|nr:DUF1553 domain-containing protein [Candidatus Paceibacterota bacterium]
MMKVALSALVALVAVVANAANPEPDPGVFETSILPAPQSQIDRLVRARLSELGMQPVLCSDAVFIRRVYLDVIGLLPTAQEVREFLQDPDTQNKRGILIDRLLGREEFAQYWAMKWGDILRIKAEFPVNLWPNAAQAYHRWVQASIARNKPYDQFARELLTSSGSNFRVGPVNFYRAIQDRTPEGIASAVALTFMGARADAWPKGQLTGMAACFSQIGYKPTREWKEEVVFWDPLNTGAPETNSATNVSASARTNAASQTAVLPDGTRLKLSPERDPRDVFADWLITPRNPWFTRNIANRVWSWLLGRGIIHEPDDIRSDNPPGNPALLAYLEKELVTSRYNLKHLYRLILNSQTYQFSSRPCTDVAQGEANFGSYSVRRLEAEVLIDAINQVTGTSDLYTSAIPEPFTYIPANQPAVALADGSITSTFLALFGRSARATGMENERGNKMLSAQWLHLLNSSHIQRKLEQGPKLKEIINSRRKSPEMTEELYLTILSRYPTPAEVKTVEDYGRPARPRAAKKREDWVDIAWALINSTEFLYRH